MTPDSSASGGASFWVNLGRPGSVYLLAEALGKGGTYLLFIAIATFLSVEDFGLLNVLLALMTVLGALVAMGLPDGVVRFHFEDVPQQEVFTIAALGPLAATAGLAALVLPWRSHLAGFLNVPPALILGAVIGAALVALRQVWLGVLRSRREALSFLLYRALEPGLFFIAITAWVVTGRSIAFEGAAGAYLAVLFVLASAGLVTGAVRIGVHWRPSAVRPIMAFSLPLVTHTFAMTGLALVDQLILQQLKGPDSAGEYAFAYRFGMAMSLVALALSHAWGPLALERLQRAKACDLAPLANRAFRGILASAVVLAWCLPPVAQLVAKEPYQAGVLLIPAIVYAYLWMALYTLVAVFLVFRGRTKALAAVSSAVFLLNVLLNYAAIPVWGLAAAAGSTVLCHMALAFTVWRTLRSDRQTLAWRRYALVAILTAPVILAPSLVYR